MIEKGWIMNLVRCLAVSAGSVLLLCSCANVPPPLRALGCKNLPAGEEIRAVQRALIDQGYDPGPADGQMGRKTREALRQFQADEGLRAAGTDDAASLEALGFCAEPASAAPASAHPPTSNPQVQEAQRLLTERGYAPGPVDGLMGNKTREALRRFQGDMSLSVSGRLDEQTLGALRSSARPASEKTPPAPGNPPVANTPAALPQLVPVAVPSPENADDFALPPTASPMPAPPSEIAPTPVSPMPTPPPESTDGFALPPSMTDVPQEITAGSGQAEAPVPAAAKEQAPPSPPDRVGK
jgi:peptidoglycan hydrolase-like protein with peptidoglycan-binding domain